MSENLTQTRVLPLKINSLKQLISLIFFFWSIFLISPVKAETEILYDESSLEIFDIIERLQLNSARYDAENATARFKILSTNTLTNSDIALLEAEYSYDWILLPKLTSIEKQDFDRLLQLNFSRGLILPISKLSSLSNCPERSDKYSGVKKNVFILGKQDIPKDLFLCYPNVNFVIEDIISLKETPKNLKYLFLSAKLDQTSVPSLIDYSGEVYIRGNQFPDWLKMNIKEVKWTSLVFLDLQNISKPQAKILHPFSGKKISFSNLETLTPATARKLNDLSSPKILSFPKINELSPKALSLLAQNENIQELSLGIKELTPEHVQALSGAKPKISFPQVRNFSDQTAAALVGLLDQNTEAHHPLDLHFLGLEELSPATAKQLLDGLLMKKNGSDFFFHKLEFNLPALDLEMLKIINDFSKPHRSNRHWSQDPNKIFAQAKSLSPDAIDWRLNSPGPYKQRIHPQYICGRSIKNLTQINPETAHKILEICTGRKLTFTKFSSISAETLNVLCRHNASIAFPALKTISQQQAEIIAESTLPSIQLRNLSSIEKQSLIILSKYNGNLAISHSFKQHPAVFDLLFPKHISLKTALSFAEIPDAIFEKIPALDPKEFKSLHLVNITHLSPKQAELIAQFQGEALIFEKLLWKPKIAQEIASFSGKEINISQFSKQDLIHLQALKEFQGEKIRIWNIKQISEGDLELLSTFKVQNLDLIFKTFNFELAPLASYQGHLEILDASSLQNVESLFQNFSGQSLTISRLDLLTTKSVRAVANNETKIQVNKIEDIEAEIIETIRQNPQKTFFLNYASQEFCQLANIKSEACLAEKEMEESLRYWEDHDCGEHDEEEHYIPDH